MPEFGTQKNLKAPAQLDEAATLSEDDSVIIHLKSSCDVARAAYASIVFAGSTPSRGKVVMMKAGSDEKSLKGKLKVADLKPVVRADSILKWLQWACM